MHNDSARLVFAALSSLACGMACGQTEKSPPMTAVTPVPAQTGAPTQATPSNAVPAAALPSAAPVAQSWADAGGVGLGRPHADPLHSDGDGEGIGLGSNGPSNRPSIRNGQTKVTGKLPPEVVQRIVRQSFAKYHACYEAGLAKDPTLRGRVSVAFTIDKTGAPTAVKSDASDLPNKDVIACVTKAFEKLSFPAPEGGTVSVVYPLSFSPAPTSEH